MKVGLLTERQKNELVGQKYDGVMFYNPIQDASDNWVISTLEINQTNDPEFVWVKVLPLIDYVAKPYPNPPL